MKNMIFFILLLSSLNLTPQDKTLIGKYSACWDMCFFDCHTQLFFELKSDSTYIFNYLDDVSIHKSEGNWRFQNDTITFVPFKLPDSVKIYCYYDRSVKDMKYQDFPYDPLLNVFWILKSDDKRLVNIVVDVYQNSTLKSFQTDSFGHFKYDGKPADSIKFVVNNKEFNFKPNQINQPSWIKAYITTTNKDLIYRLVDGKLRFIDGSPGFYYNCDEVKGKKLLFEKNGSIPDLPARTIFPK